MYVQVEPDDELTFDTAGGRLSDATLTLRNLIDQRVAYKLFTDNVDLFLIKPNCGFIEPRETVQISVKLTRAPENLVLEYTTVVKTRVAKPDEVDRDKEWRLLTNLDDPSIQTVKLPSRFRRKREPKAPPDDSSKWRALEQNQQKLQDSVEQLSGLVKLLFLAVVVILILVIGSM